MSHKKPTRVIMYPSDFVKFYGNLSQASIYRKWQYIRDAVGKKKGEPLNAYEFSTFSGLPIEVVIAALN